jgi:hypothetical protein
LQPILANGASRERFVEVARDCVGTYYISHLQLRHIRHGVRETIITLRHWIHGHTVTFVCHHELQAPVPR